MGSLRDRRVSVSSLVVDIRQQTIELCKQARASARLVAAASTTQKNRWLSESAVALRQAGHGLLKANAIDVENGRAAGLSTALLDRLTITTARIDAMATGLEEIAALADPVGETISRWRRPNGLDIAQVRIPLGVVGIIYESRPNVTADAAALCIKSGNAVVLKGGKEAIRTNTAIAAILAHTAAHCGLPAAAVQLVPSTDRLATQTLLQQSEYIDVIVPRGGESLIRAITAESKIPVVQHYAGVCHTYVDEFADLAMAESICFNAKVQRPGVCNAMENMLVNAKVAKAFLPAMLKRFADAKVEIRGCDRTREIVAGIKPASDEDWRTEYLELILAVKVVDSLDEAITFINTHGTGHSDAIVTRDYDHARRFQAAVDSAAVYVNASTRFTDGYEFGFGAEIGISTNRLHARGPMGLRELTTYKYIVSGDGQIRE